MLKKYSIFQLFILKQVYGHSRFLSILYFLILVPSQAICVVACGMLGSFGLGSFEPWSGLLYLLSRLDIFPISLGDYSYFSSLILMDASRKKIPSHNQ